MKRRQVEVLQGQGAKLADAVRQIGVTQQIYYRWRREFGRMNRDQLKQLKALEQENTRLRRVASDLTLDKLILSETARVDGRPALLSPSRRRQCINHVRQNLGLSERRACRALGQHRSTQRKIPAGRQHEALLTADITELARKYGWYGYRQITGLMHPAGWCANHKRVDRIWRREAL